MSTPTNHWKLGLFVVVGVAAVVGAALVLGERAMRTDNITYRTYFDESVQGLDVGAPVKFRGVSIGNVTDIDLAGDRRHVEVTYALGVKVLNSLGLAAKRSRGAKTQLVIPLDLRVQLASSGLTDVKFLQMDFFTLETNPPPVLPFEVPENYIPAVASTMKNVVGSVVAAVDRLPAVMAQMEGVLTQVSLLVTDVQKAKWPARVSEVLAVLTRVLARIDGALDVLAPEALSKEARATMQSIQAMLGSLTQVLSRLDGERGLAASVLKTSDSLGRLAQDAQRATPALEEVLTAVRATAASVSRLSEALERDPEMLLKGRAKGGPR